MRELFESPHAWILAFLAAVAVAALLFARRYPRQARTWMLWADRWSGPIILGLGLAVFFCGSVGFGLLEQNDPDSIPFSLYETFQIFYFNVDVDRLERSGWLIAAMLFSAAFTTALLAKVIGTFFHDSYIKTQLALASGHVVICGMGRIGRQVVADLIQARDRRTIVVVDSDAECAELPFARENGALVVLGDATDREVLRSARIGAADEIFVVTGNDERNIEGVLEVRELVARERAKDSSATARKTVRCHVHVHDLKLAGSLRSRAIELESLDRGGSKESPPLDIEVFNLSERTANHLLEKVFAPTFVRELGEDDVAHFVVLGFDEFGQALAARLAECANFKNCRRTRMTIVDREIKKKARDFVARYPRFGSPPVFDAARWSLGPEADEWTHRQIDSGSRGIEYVCNAEYLEYVQSTDGELLKAIFERGGRDRVKLAVFVCFENESEDFVAAEYLRSQLDARNKAWPIYFWIPRSGAVSRLLAADQDERSAPTKFAVADVPPCNVAAAGLYAFGECVTTASYAAPTSTWIDWLARLLHLAWVEDDASGAYVRPPAVVALQSAIALDDPTDAMSKLDWNKLDAVARSEWENLPEWARASNRSAALHAVLRAAAVGFVIEGVTDGEPRPVSVAASEALQARLRKMEHYRWVSERLIAGWSHDEVRDDERRTRWQLVPWDELSNPPQSVRDEAAREGREPRDERLKDAKIVRLTIGLIRVGKLKARPFGSKLAVAAQST